MLGFVMRASQTGEEMEEGGEWDALIWLESRMWRTPSIVMTWSSLSMYRAPKIFVLLHTTVQIIIVPSVSNNPYPHPAVRQDELWPTSRAQNKYVVELSSTLM